MSWSKLHGGSQRHPKVVALEVALGVSELEARGLALGLWAWVIETEPSGDLSAHSALSIARGLAWRGDPAALVDALVQVRLLDRDGDRVVVHDWDEHAAGWIEAQRARKNRNKASRKRTVSVQYESGTRTRSSGTNTGASLSPSLSQISEGSAEGSPPKRPPKPPPEPAVIEVPCAGGKTFGVTKTQIDRWSELYPAVDALAVVRNAVGWAEANPTKRKTAGRCASWLATVWLARAQNEAGAYARAARAGVPASAMQPPSASIDELPPLPASYGRPKGQLVLARPKEPYRASAPLEFFGDQHEAEA